MVFDLEAGKQRRVVLIEFQTAYVVRHDVAHKFGDLVVDFLVVHQDFADVGAIVVADGANEQRAFHEEQVRVVVCLAGFFDGLPELFEVVQIPFQLFRATADACGAGDDAHAVRNVEFGHSGFEFYAFFEHVLNARPAAFVVLEIGTGHLFKRQKAVPVGSVIDETRFQRRLDARDDTFIDIAFALLFAQRFDVEVEQVLAVDNRHAQLFGLRGIK